MNDPYSSHVPFLTRIAGDQKLILELGSGLYSTPLFLNKGVYKCVEKVVSVESLPVWADKVRAVVNDDRLDLLVVPEPIEEYLDTLDLDCFDLIFVDNSEWWETRVKTIEYLGQRVKTAKVVIHDFEHSFYQAAAREFVHRIVDVDRVPNTALVWK